MLESVDVGTQRISSYESSVGAESVDQLREPAAPLRGARVLHINATPYGGGVAEILRSEIPLLRDLGIVADWKLITGEKEFFTVTKAIHNGLQGAERELTPTDQETYLAYSTRNAALLEEAYDLVVVHDPQPLALLRLHGKDAAKWIWRCHIDTSEPNPQVWSFLLPHLAGYDAAVFTLGSFAPPDAPIERVEIIPPAIDPESPKNIELGLGTAGRLLRWIGVDVDKPLVTQVSRFDPWKDPLGVIAAYQLVKQEVPDLRLALVGSMALDDPEGWEIECAEKTWWLLQHPEEGEALGAKGRELVRERFLLTRLIADELRLYGDLLGTRQLPTPVAKVGLAGEERDPVCGMLLDPQKAPEKYEHEGHRYYFCSRSCQAQFEAAPEYFLRAVAGVPGS